VWPGKNDVLEVCSLSEVRTGKRRSMVVNRWRRVEERGIDGRTGVAEAGKESRIVWFDRECGVIGVAWRVLMTRIFLHPDK
jgi:hypothetical protein